LSRSGVKREGEGSALKKKGGERTWDLGLEGRGLALPVVQSGAVGYRDSIGEAEGIHGGVEW